MRDQRPIILVESGQASSQHLKPLQPLKDRDYRLEANVLGSNIRGSEEAILIAQQSSARYYQRPDNESATLDPTRTTLSGNSGSVRFTRTNNHKLQR